MSTFEKLVLVALLLAFLVLGGAHAVVQWVHYEETKALHAALRDEFFPHRPAPARPWWDRFHHEGDGHHGR